MSDILQLTEDERKWRDELQYRISQFLLEADYYVRIRELPTLRDIAMKLHQSLKERGHEPKHHAYMISNRGLHPDHPEFYLHINSLQDLIKFTVDPHANDDRVDQTIGHYFEIRIFSRRWNCEHIYRLKRTKYGWSLDIPISCGECDEGAQPHFFDSLKRDNIQYPHGVSGWFRWVWDQANQYGLSHDQVQGELIKIAEWINSTEKQAPSFERQKDSRLLEKDIERLQNAIRKHRDQKGDDRCWLDDRELYSVLPEGYVEPGPQQDAPETMLSNCKRFIKSRHDPSCKYLSTNIEIELLRAALAEIRDSKFSSYDNVSSEQYGIGVADGHRYCSEIARKVLIKVGEKTCLT